MVPTGESARCASTCRGSGRSTTVHAPAPTSGHSRSVRIIRSNQASSEFGSRRCAVTFTRRYPYSPRSMTGRISRSAGAPENPPLWWSDHCIGVRTASRPCSDRSSPMPISAP